MGINVNWNNPYENRKGSWLKGNLHAHTSPNSACSLVQVKDCVDLYVERGYDFLVLSDHLSITPYKDDRITLLPGIEWNDATGYHHAGVYFVSKDKLKTAISIGNQDELLPKMDELGALLILNHPDWHLIPHYRREQLERISPYHGIEIFNGVVERAEGYAISTDKWDYLLTKGRRVLGFASDDSHEVEDIDRGSICVRSATNQPRDIIKSIWEGNFYASSGALIDDIRMQDGIIEVETPSGEEIVVSGKQGRYLMRVRDRAAKFDTNGVDSSYVRFTVFARGSDMAWTQPFFLRDGA